MPAITEFPTVVEKAREAYRDLFANHPERTHFCEYLTGLLVADRKTVRGINSEFAQTTDQSCLNRFLTHAPWNEYELNERRLRELQRDPSTRFRARGTIAIDNVLTDHQGKEIQDVGYFWDHAEKRYLIAHDDLVAGYVTPSGTHYPLDSRRFRKKEQCRGLRHPFRSHTDLFLELVDWVADHDIPGDFTFDCYFTAAAILNHIHRRGRAYVGDLKVNRKVLFEGTLQSAQSIAESISPLDRRPLEEGDERQWIFSRTVRIPKVDHPVRLVIVWTHQADLKPHKIFVTNRTSWETARTLGVYRRRWTGTETFYRDGKQHLGMGDCQLRKRRGQNRHLYMTFVAYSLLMSQLHRGRAREWALTKPTTIGEACRAVLRETLSKTISWVLEKVSQGWAHHAIKEQLALP